MYQHKYYIYFWYEYIQYIYIRGGTVHRCHGSVRTSVRGSRFDTISVQHEKKEIYYALFLFIYFEQISKLKKNQSRCENTTYYYMLYIYNLFCFHCECTQIKADLYTVIINNTSVPALLTLQPVGTLSK